MKTSKIIIGGVVGAIVFFLLGWLIYGMMLMDFMAANTNQAVSRPMDEMQWWAMIASVLFSALLLACVFSYAGTSNAMDGAKVGAIIGILASARAAFRLYAMSTFYSNLTVVAVDVIVFTIMAAIAGAVIAWVMNRGN